MHIERYTGSQVCWLSEQKNSCSLKKRRSRSFLLLNLRGSGADKATRTRKIKHQEIAVLIKGQTRYRFFLFVDRKTRIPK